MPYGTPWARVNPEREPHAARSAETVPPVWFGCNAPWAAGCAGLFRWAALTHFGGLVLPHRFIQRLGLRADLAHTVRFAQRNNHHSTAGAILALVYPIILGLERIETTQLLRRNGFRAGFGLPVVRRLAASFRFAFCRSVSESRRKIGCHSG